MKTLSFLLAMVSLLVSCRSHEYYDKLEKELASGQRYDSLFLDISLGMTQKDFYAHCWEMNKQGIVTHGGQNMTVEYEMPDQLKAEAKMNFYPDFHEGKVYKMPVTFTYKAWAPWNEHLSADSLLLDLVELYKVWYDDDFIKVGKEGERVAYIMIKGNRRISLYKKNVSEVEAMYTDLLIERKLEEAKKQEAP